jgi:hypothetical protein
MYVDIFKVLMALLEPSKKMGVKGMHPLDCLPLWGREGVPLTTAHKTKRITGKSYFNKAVLMKNAV